MILVNMWGVITACAWSFHATVSCRKELLVIRAHDELVAAFASGQICMVCLVCMSRDSYARRGSQSTSWKLHCHLVSDVGLQ